MRVLKLLFVLLLSLAVDGAGPTLPALEAELDEIEEAAHRGWRGPAGRPPDVPAPPRTAVRAAAAERRLPPPRPAPRRPVPSPTTPRQPVAAADSPASPEDH